MMPWQSRILGTSLILCGLLALGAISGCCCCCVTGGGMTARADAMADLHKEAEVGIGGPGWWLFKHLGLRFVKTDDLAATLAMKGISGLQVSSYVLERPSADRQREILEFYAAPLRNEGWELLARTQQEDQQVVVYARAGEEHFRGLFVIVFEGNKLNVVKISGDLRPEMFAELNVRLPALGNGLPEASKAP